MARGSVKAAFIAISERNHMRPYAAYSLGEAYRNGEQAITALLS